MQLFPELVTCQKVNSIFTEYTTPLSNPYTNFELCHPYLHRWMHNCLSDELSVRKGRWLGIWGCTVWTVGKFTWEICRNEQSMYNTHRAVIHQTLYSWMNAVIIKIQSADSDTPWNRRWASCAPYATRVSWQYRDKAYKAGVDGAEPDAIFLPAPIQNPHNG